MLASSSLSTTAILVDTGRFLDVVSTFLYVMDVRWTLNNVVCLLALSVKSIQIQRCLIKECLIMYLKKTIFSDSKNHEMKCFTTGIFSGITRDQL